MLRRGLTRVWLQAPGKWASLLKGSNAPASTKASTASPAPPAAPAPAPEAAPAAAPAAPAPAPASAPTAPSQDSGPTTQEAATPAAPAEETPEEKIKRLEAEVAELKAQQEPKKARGWGPPPE